MIRVEEKYSAHGVEMDASGSFTRAEVTYIITGANNEDDALEAAHNNAPASWDGLSLEAFEIAERAGDDVFFVRVSYSASSDNNDDQYAEDTTPTVSFDCGGGTMHLTHSYDQRVAYGSKDAGGAIGWNGKTGAEMSITGVDVPTAQLRETYTKVMQLSRITTSFKRKVAKLVGKVNASTFKGWNKGEVMFLGMSYSCPAKKKTKVTVTFNFAIQMNESVKIAGKSISKKGFEYAWALSKTEADGNTPKADVEAIYVDQVCQYASFSLLGL